MAGMTEDATELLERLAQVNPVVAARSLLEGEPEVDDGFKSLVTSALIEAMTGNTDPAEARAQAGRTLARLGDPRPGVGVRDDGLPDIVWCEVPAGPFLRGDDKEKDESITEPYRIGRYPVTNAQFETFVRAGGYQKERYWREAIEKGYWSDGAIKTGWDEPYTAPEDYGEPDNLPNALSHNRF